MKEENQQTVILTEAVLFDHQLIQRITFDLIHINQGWDNEKHDYANRRRSSYTSEEIVDFFEQFKYFSVEWLLGTNKENTDIRGVPHYRYHWETTDEKGDTVRVVLDLPQAVTGEGIIVTIFKP